MQQQILCGGTGPLCDLIGPPVSPPNFHWLPGDVSHSSQSRRQQPHKLLYPSIIDCPSFFVGNRCVVDSCSEGEMESNSRKDKQTNRVFIYCANIMKLLYELVEKSTLSSSVDVGIFHRATVTYFGIAHSVI